MAAPGAVVATTAGVPGWASGRPAELDRVVAAVLAVMVGLRIPLAGGITLAVLLALCLLPVLVSSLRHPSPLRWLMALGVPALVSGVLLTEFWSDGHRTAQSLLRDNTLSLLGLLTACLALVWAARQLGPTRMATWYGLGLIGGIAFAPAAESNPWKFTFSIPIAVLLLALAARSGRWWLEAGVLVLLAAVSATQDSRSAAAIMLLAVVLLVRQRIHHWRRLRSGTARTLLSFALLLVGGFFLIQAVLVEGLLGPSLAERTQRQIDLSGSLLTGGRPEVGAAVALIGAYPFGLGAGTFATAGEVALAREGMQAFSYVPAAGYVDRYMFGGGYEVHSMLGNLWLRFGLLGAAVAVLLGWVVVVGAVRLLARRAATGLVLFLALQVGWDLLFSPFFPTTISSAALAVALVTVPGRADPAEPEPPRLSGRPVGGPTARGRAGPASRAGSGPGSP